MMNANEPTTGEIVRALRGGGIYGITTALELKVIARLESQERELSGITGELERMTARAEQAEADIKKFAHTSHTCGHNESGLCKLAADDHGFCEKCPAWVYRGQPQDGEGV